MTIILFLSVLLSGYIPKQGTLAYATELSRESLLQATNYERTSRNKGELKLNDSLSKAAQAKAEDMTARNYWSHNTPDGQEPWVFINNVGYAYIKAGENLAYGFATSRDTVTGWMNSPSHRDNMLDQDYIHVGFGYANSSNYNKAGQETVVVAMYGYPQNTDQSQTSNTTPVINSGAGQRPAEQQTTTPANNSIVNSNPAILASSKPVTRIESITQGKAPWALAAISFITGGIVVLLLVRYGYRIRRLIKDSENFVLHHPLIDSTLVALVILGITLTRTVGFIL